MKVKDFINQLQRYNNLDDDIIGVYWAYDDVSDGELSDNNWQELVRRFDNYDFQQSTDDIFDTLVEIKEEDND
mgnify:CR=1 FL=1